MKQEFDMSIMLMQQQKELEKYRLFSYAIFDIDGNMRLFNERDSSDEIRHVVRNSYKNYGYLISTDEIEMDEKVFSFPISEQHGENSHRMQRQQMVFDTKSYDSQKTYGYDENKDFANCVKTLMSKKNSTPAEVEDALTFVYTHSMIKKDKIRMSTELMQNILYLEKGMHFVEFEDITKEQLIEIQQLIERYPVLSNKIVIDNVAEELIIYPALYDCIDETSNLPETEKSGELEIDIER